MQTFFKRKVLIIKKRSCWLKRNATLITTIGMFRYKILHNILLLNKIIFKNRSSSLLVLQKPQRNSKPLLWLSNF